MNLTLFLFHLLCLFSFFPCAVAQCEEEWTALNNCVASECPACNGNTTAGAVDPVSPQDADRVLCQTLTTSVLEFCDCCPACGLEQDAILRCANYDSCVTCSGTSGVSLVLATVAVAIGSFFATI